MELEKRPQASARKTAASGRHRVSETEVFHFHINCFTPRQYLKTASGLWENVSRWTCGLLDWVRLLRLDR